MILLYSFALLLVLVIGAPWWLLQMARSGRYREGLAERLGYIAPRLRIDPGAIWLHAVSVGEVLAASQLIRDLESRGYAVCISTTTRAGQQLARERFGAERVFYYPLDLAFAVRAWLRILRPRMLITMESELWPRMLTECSRLEIPVVVCNARMSDRSLPRYTKLQWFWWPFLQKTTLMLAQSDEDARRWRSVGVPRVVSVGNLKYDVRAASSNTTVEAVRAALSADARVLVCGSTLEGEEEVLLQCFEQTETPTIMLLAPRHPQRFDAVAKLLNEKSVAHTRLSTWRENPAALHPGQVLLIDTIGDLAALYSLATVAFVGGSIVDGGGHNPLEPAQWGRPVVMGPHYGNFRTMIDAMRRVEAICIADDPCAAIGTRLRTPDAALGERGREFFHAQAGATTRTIEALIPLLESAR